MELKRIIISTSFLPVHPINRTRMELKPAGNDLIELLSRAINRTRMELKLCSSDCGRLDRLTINRTRMELKQIIFSISIFCGCYQSHQNGIETDELIRELLAERVYQSHQNGIETGNRQSWMYSIASINRTRMELKPIIFIWLTLSLITINRTRMELKPLMLVFQQ